MTHVPAVEAKTLERVLLRLGFVAVRQKGSHVFYRHVDGRTTTIPHHAGMDVAAPLLREILREAKVTPEEFLLELQA